VQDIRHTTLKNNFSNRFPHVTDVKMNSQHLTQLQMVTQLSIVLWCWNITNAPRMLGCSVQGLHTTALCLQVLSLVRWETFLLVSDKTDSFPVT